MVSALSALKNAGKKNLAQELAETPKEEAPVEEVQEETTSEETSEEGEAEGQSIDVDALTSKQLDELVKQVEGVEIPADWKKWKKDQKVAWFHETFDAAEETGEAEEAGEAAEEEAPVEETAAVNLVEPIAEPVAEPAKTVAKSKTKGKTTAIATQNVKHGDVLSPDEFSSTVAEIENLKAKDALELVKMLSDASDFTLFKLGGVLSRINEDGWYKELGFASFRDYVDNTQNVGYRTASYWIAIYRNLVNSGVPYSAVSSVKWSKLKEIAAVINPDNVEDWVEKANGNNIETLKALVKSYNPAGTKEITDQLSKVPENAITTMTFKVHADQRLNIEAALEKAKAEAKTDVSTVALEAICIAFNSNAVASKPGKKVDPKTVLAALGIEDAAQALVEAFPDLNIDITVNDNEETSEAA